MKRIKIIGHKTYTGNRKLAIYLWECQECGETRESTNYKRIVCKCQKKKKQDVFYEVITCNMCGKKKRVLKSLKVKYCSVKCRSLGRKYTAGDRGNWEGLSERQRPENMHKLNRTTSEVLNAIEDREYDKVRSCENFA